MRVEANLKLIFEGLKTLSGYESQSAQVKFNFQFTNRQKSANPNSVIRWKVIEAIKNQLITQAMF